MFFIRASYVASQHQDTGSPPNSTVFLCHLDTVTLYNNKGATVGSAAGESWPRKS